MGGSNIPHVKQKPVEQKPATKDEWDHIMDIILSENEYKDITDETRRNDTVGTKGRIAVRR